MATVSGNRRAPTTISTTPIYLGTPKTTHIFNNWGMGLSKGEVLADPEFRNRARRNFTLVARSPAAGMGAK